MVLAMSRENLQEILAALVPFAQSQLEDLGHCPPVAASLDGTGDIDLHMPPVGVGGSTEEFVDRLKVALRAGARSGDYEAVGLCREVTAQRMSDPKPVDAIGIHLEAPGESLEFFLPFHRDGEGEVHYGETFFGPADAEIYPER